MYDMAKKARSAMKAKASRLSSADPKQKVDSSTWTPPEALNTEAKTGLRPISRRGFKSGGSVKGEKAKCNMGRAPRKSGGEAGKYAIAKINRNVKEANEERPGVKHVGGMKKGGRAAKQNGGNTSNMILDSRAPEMTPENMPMTPEQERRMRAIMEGQAAADRAYEDKMRARQDFKTTGRKAGGRTKKMEGGAMAGAADMMSKAQKTAGVPSATLSSVPTTSRLSKAAGLKKGGMAARKGRNSGGANDGKNVWDQVTITSGDKGKGLISDPAAGTPFDTIDKAKAENQRRTSGYPVGLKKGGKAHADEAMDKALIKKMVKSSARKGRADGGRDMIDAAMAGDRKLDSSPDDASKALYLAVNANAGDRKPRGKMANSLFREMNERKGHKLAEADQSIYRRKDGGKAKHSDEKMDIALIKKMVKPESRTARKEGGGVFSGPGYPGKIPGVTGGRIARATGGKTKGKGKGKTNINIIIAAGKSAGPADMMGPPPGMDAGPQGLPVPVPAPQGGAPGAAPMPMPVPMPMPAAPAGGPPMPRKSGGRLTAKASSYKDMTAGSGSGEGRLQKTDIAKARMGRKAGGKAYRSYKDMDAGAGSGLGRLEKTEIQAHKR